MGKLGPTFCLAWALFTTVEPLTLPELAARAERILEARVATVNPARDARGRPATRVVFEPLSVLKGSAASSVEVLLPGGAIDGERLTIAGIPQFREGEEVVVFLSGKSSAGLTVPIGLGQGTYRAVLDRLRPDLGATVERGPFLAEVRRLAGAR